MSAKIEATFEVYGTHIDELREAAFEQGVKFFRLLDEEIEIVALKASPVVHTAAGEVTRWKGFVTMSPIEEDEE